MNKLINIFEYESLAPKYLSLMALDYYTSGAWDEVTLQDNPTAYKKYKLRARMLVDVSQGNLSTKVLGQLIKMPILIAPTALQCLAHPEEELATARVAADNGLSTMSTKSLENLALAANVPKSLWFQIYVYRDRSLTRTLVERAEVAGYQALCLTVDAQILGVREWGSQRNFTGR